MREVNWYSNITAAIPETMAENRNTIGMRGELHHGFAFTDPKMNPTYPCSRNADGMPMMVMTQPTLSSIRRLCSLMFDDPRVSARYTARRHPVAVRENITISRR